MQYFGIIYDLSGYSLRFWIFYMSFYQGIEIELVGWSSIKGIFIELKWFSEEKFIFDQSMRGVCILP